MKKILVAAAFSLLLPLNSFAADFIKGGYYAGVGAGIEDFAGYSSYDMGFTLLANFGKPIIKLGPGVLGAEGEFTYTVSPLEYENSYYKDEMTIATLGAYATYTYDFTDKFYGRGKLGIVYRDYDHDGSYRDYSYRYYDYRYGYVGSYSSLNVALGVGGGYKISDKMRLFSDFIVTDGFDLRQLNFGVQMSF